MWGRKGTCPGYGKTLTPFEVMGSVPKDYTGLNVCEKAQPSCNCRKSWLSGVLGRNNRTKNRPKCKDRPILEEVISISAKALK